MFDDNVVTKPVPTTLSTAELTVFRKSFCSEQVVVGQAGYFNFGLARYAVQIYLFLLHLFIYLSIFQFYSCCIYLSIYLLNLFLLTPAPSVAAVVESQLFLGEFSGRLLLTFRLLGMCCST